MMNVFRGEVTGKILLEWNFFFYLWNMKEMRVIQHYGSGMMYISYEYIPLTSFVFPDKIKV